MTAAPARRTRVLIVSALQIHPPRSGGNLRSLALGSALARHGFEVFVHSLVGRKADYLERRRSAAQVWPTGVGEHVDRGVCGFVAQYGSYALGLPPLWIPAFLSAAAASRGERLMPRALRARLAWSDVVVADFPFVHPAFQTPSARGRLRVLSTHNVEHHLLHGATGWLGRLLRERVRRVEHAAADASDVLVACSESDKAYFEQNTKASLCLVVPNGIDTGRFAALADQRSPARRDLGVPDDVRVFLFTGSKWGPNREAFEYLKAFAVSQGELLQAHRILILVVGSVAAEPQSLPGFRATGAVDHVERYFAAADAALNPITSGAGTNVKMAEFLAARLPILTTAFGARGLRIDDGRSGFLFERDGLAAPLLRLRRMFAEEPARLHRIAALAYAENQAAVDMDTCVRPLVEALRARRPAPDAVQA